MVKIVKKTAKFTEQRLLANQFNFYFVIQRGTSRELQFLPNT